MGARRAATPPAELRRKAAELDEYRAMLLHQEATSGLTEIVHDATGGPAGTPMSVEPLPALAMADLPPVLADRLAFLQEWAAELRTEANGES